MGENENRIPEVIEAGEWFAQGLSLLAATQFDEELFWNSSPIRALRDRWRVEFSWGIAGFDELDEFGPEGEDDEDDEDDDVDQFGENVELDETDEDEELGVMAR